MKKLICVVLVSFVFISVQAFAVLAPGTTIEDYLPTISGDILDDSANGNQYTFTSLDEFEVEETKFKLKGAFTLLDGPTGTIVLEELEFDPDPSVFANLVVTNNSSVTQTYNFTVNQPAYLADLYNQVFGSIVVSLQDQDVPENSATLANLSGPVYTANIDGSPVDTLLSSYSLSTPSGSAYASGSDMFGLDPYNGSVNTSISIDLSFTLSAGDSASVVSRFDVIPVPEPATMMLLGLGGLLIRRKR